MKYVAALLRPAVPNRNRIRQLLAVCSFGLAVLSASPASALSFNFDTAWFAGGHPPASIDSSKLLHFQELATAVKNAIEEHKGRPEHSFDPSHLHELADAVKQAIAEHKSGSGHDFDFSRVHALAAAVKDAIAEHKSDSGHSFDPARLHELAGAVRDAIAEFKSGSGDGWHSIASAAQGVSTDTPISTPAGSTDAVGYTANNPLLPDRSPAPGSYEIDLVISDILGLDLPIYVDPVVATGFTYTIGEGGANFASVVVPGALPGGDDTFSIVFDTDTETITETLLAEQTFNFLDYIESGVATFTILGIDVAEMIDPEHGGDHPFVVGLTFVDGFESSTLYIDAITVDTDAPLSAAAETAVPLPAAFPLFLTAIGGMGLFGWFRKRRAAATAEAA